MREPFAHWDEIISDAYHRFGNQCAEQRAHLNLVRQELREFECRYAQLLDKATDLRKSQRAYMEVRKASVEIRDAVGRAVAQAADELDEALAAATGTAKTPQAVECEASQSGPKGNAQPNPQPIKKEKGK